jgi:signal transduction histidine kinase
MRRSTVFGCRERPAPTETMRAHARDTQRARTQAPGHPSPRAVEQRRLSRARLAGAAQERRRVARDLHDGVQNELVSLILGLSLAEDDPNTPPELAASLSVLRAQAQSTLSGIRGIAHGIRPPLLAAAGVIPAAPRAGDADTDHGQSRRRCSPQQ